MLLMQHLFQATLFCSRVGIMNRLEPKMAQIVVPRVFAGSPEQIVRPSGRTSRAANPRVASHSGALSPSTIAAVLAMFASTHDAAATLAVLHTSAVGSPFAGSTM